MPWYNPLYSQLEKPKSNMFIYGLCDPDTNELRYIGQTIQGFRRIQEHYNQCQKRNKTTKQLSRSKVWINSLKKQNKIFKVIYLEYTDELFKLDELENFYITYFRFLGCILLNDLTGGKFASKKHWSKENREMISKRTKEAMNTPEIKEKCRQHAFKTVAGYNKGKKFSQEFKDKISKSQESKVQYIQDSNGNVHRGSRAAAKALGCTQSGINHCLKGRSKTIRGLTLKVIQRGS